MDTHSFEQRFPGRAKIWRLRTRVLTLPARPLLMGIVNVTPDSFSDGGSFFDPAKAIAHGLQLAADGADILDVGGESTRPFSTAVATDEELQRVLPVVEALVNQTGLPVSIDTSKAAVARETLSAGVEIVNDITGLTGDSGMLETVLAAGAAVCAMHMQGTPQTMQVSPHYENVVADIHRYLQHRRDALTAAGLTMDQLALDPGIGFGKTHQHNLELVAGCHSFHDLGCPLLVGHSRKGFIGKVLGNAQADRTAGNLGVALALAQQGVQVLRVHDVAATRQALLLYEAVGALTGQPLRLPS